MSASHASMTDSAPTARLHLTEGICPTCEQPIPRDRFDEIRERIEARQRERSVEISARLHDQFAREKALAVEEAQQEAAAALEREKQQANVKVSAARDEGRLAAEAAVQERVAAVERGSQAAISALRTRIEEVEAAKTSAVEAGNSLQARLNEVQRESASAIAQLKHDGVAKEETIRAEARRAAEADVQTKIVELQQGRRDSEASLQARIDKAEADKNAAEDVNATRQAELDQIRRESSAAIEKVRQDAATREIEIRQEANVVAVASVQATIDETDRARLEAVAKAAAAERQVQALTVTHQAELAQRLDEQRAALEQAQTAAVNAEKSTAFEEKMRLSAKVEDLQRAVDKKTAEELGEGAEIDLFEALKAEFEADRIEHVNKGQPGADILHTVMHNGRECGKIIYDSKNHGVWRTEFVTKLASDQMAAKAEHAILSTRKFPTGRRQLCVQDGIVLVSPARVVALVMIIRQHLVQTSTLRLSNESRTQKSAALYAFITSERCVDLFSRIDTHAEDLLELQLKEKKAHETTWKRQGQLVRSVQKVRAELCSEIDGIIGTAEAINLAR
jgi:hypothetical protein